MGLHQKLLSAETLKSRYADKLPPEPRMSSFKKASIGNVIPDPDVPPGYDLDSPEYVFHVLSFAECGNVWSGRNLQKFIECFENPFM